MNQTYCPFLGLKEDPTTAMDFPSQGNFCHHARPIRPVNGTYQEQVCLTGEHITCPLYRAAKPMPMPAEIAAPDISRGSLRRALALAGIPVLVAGAAALALTWNFFAGQFIAPQSSIPRTGPEQQNFSTFSWITRTLSPPSTETSILSENPLVANCPRPEGWVPYIVNPTDSLFRLSVIYRVSVEDLQRVNCLDDATAILPGQAIYVPANPTSTVTGTNTPVPVIPAFTPVPARYEAAPPDKNEAPPPPAPTAVPPTNVPPTDEPEATREPDPAPDNPPDNGNDWPDNWPGGGDRGNGNGNGQGGSEGGGNQDQPPGDRGNGNNSNNGGQGGPGNGNGNGNGNGGGRGNGN